MSVAGTVKEWKGTVKRSSIRLQGYPALVHEQQ